MPPCLPGAAASPCMPPSCIALQHHLSLLFRCRRCRLRMAGGSKLPAQATAAWCQPMQRMLHPPDAPQLGLPQHPTCQPAPMLRVLQAVAQPSHAAAGELALLFEASGRGLVCLRLRPHPALPCCLPRHLQQPSLGPGAGQQGTCPGPDPLSQQRPLSRVRAYGGQALCRQCAGAQPPAQPCHPCGSALWCRPLPPRGAPQQPASCPLVAARARW